MIPFVEEIVAEIDLEEQRAVIDPPPGPDRRARGRDRLDRATRTPGTRPDAARRRHDLPRVPGAAERLPRRQGPRARTARRARPRPAGLDVRPAQHRRRHPVRRRPRHGHEDRARGATPWTPSWPTATRRARTSPVLVVPTPSGRPFTQELAVELSERPWLVFTPARYEGIDRRVIDEYATRMPVYEVSIGDYVLAGGEAAVLVDHRGRGPAAARRARQRRVAPRRLLRARRDGQPAGGARLHQAARVARPRHPRGAAQRPPRQDRPLAPRRGPPPYRRPTGPT